LSWKDEAVLQHKKIKIGKKAVEAILFNLSAKNLIVLKGRKGYVMCGYLNLKAAEKFKDAAVKITGVSTIAEALKARVYSATREARRLGIYKGQLIKETLAILA
jgi:uncharacterized protein YunC (DUF1805 family)